MLLTFRNKLKKNRKGFTLAELLVVVAILAILVAVSIPIFTGRLEAAREATDEANLRALKAVVANAQMSDGILKCENNVEVDLSQAQDQVILGYTEDGTLIRVDLDLSLYSKVYTAQSKKYNKKPLSVLVTQTADRQNPDIRIGYL